MLTRPRRLAFVLLLAGGMLAVWPAVSHTQTPQDLERLVAPVALYPDDLLADVLAASTFPADIDEAADWLRQHASLSSDQVAATIDPLPWDGSVKALTEFPAVLLNMAQNLSWTSALGDAYYNDPDAVMDAVQTLRRRALAAGTLRSNANITVIDAGGIISITPASIDDVYVPTYDAWSVYGAVISPWPDFVFATNVVVGPRISWGLHVRIGGAWTRMNWGARNWHFDWHSRRVLFNRAPFVSRSPSVIDRHPVVRPPQPFPGPPPGARTPPNRGGAPTPAPATRGMRTPPPDTRVEQAPAAPRPPRPSEPPKMPPDPKVARGFPAKGPQSPPSGTRTGAMSGVDHGGTTTQTSQRGRSSMGVPPAPPPKPSTTSPKPAAPPPTPPGRGRGRGGTL
jgi:hypothetical protein